MKALNFHIDLDEKSKNKVSAICNLLHPIQIENISSHCNGLNAHLLAYVEYVKLAREIVLNDDYQVIIPKGMTDSEYRLKMRKILED